MVSQTTLPRERKRKRDRHTDKAKERDRQREKNFMKARGGNQEKGAKNREDEIQRESKSRWEK